MAQQPAGMVNDNGVILTIGMYGNNEAYEHVMPFATNSEMLTPSNVCEDAVNSFVNSAITQLANLLSSDQYVAFVAAEGMVNGAIPFRTSFGPTDSAGNAAPPAVPTNACALGVIYQDPEDAIAGDRIRLAKTFFSGISTSQVTGNLITSTLITNIEIYVGLLQSGYPSTIDGASNWYRVLNVPKPRTTGQQVKRLLVAESRGGVYTQKRRLVPRP